MEEAKEETVKTCPHCGVEVSANAKFCSACGGVVVTVCPQCGQPYDKGARFCGNCGYNLAQAKAEQARVDVPAQSRVNVSTVDMVKILRSVCKIAPPVLLTLFGVLSFLFYLTPMVVAPLLGNMGSGYQFMQGGELDIVGIRGLAVTYLTLSICTVLLSVLGIMWLTPRGRGLFVGKVSFADIFSWVSVAIYTIYLTLSIAFLVKVGESVQTATSTTGTLLLVFAIVFLLLNVACNVLRLTVCKTQTESKALSVGVWGKIFRYTPAYVFLLVAVLPFLYFLAPVLHSAELGDIGTVYQFMAGDEVLNTLDLRGFAIAYFVVAIVGVVIAIFYLLAVTTPLRKRARLGKETFLYDVLFWFAMGINIAYIVISIILSNTAKADGCSSTVADLSIVYSVIGVLSASACKALSCTRFGIRLPERQTMEQPQPPTPALLATLEESDNVQKQTKKYLKSIKGICIFAIWTILIGDILICAIGLMGSSIQGLIYVLIVFAIVAGVKLKKNVLWKQPCKIYALAKAKWFYFVRVWILWIAVGMLISVLIFYISFFKTDSISFQYGVDWEELTNEQILQWVSTHYYAEKLAPVLFLLPLIGCVLMVVTVKMNTNAFMRWSVIVGSVIVSVVAIWLLSIVLGWKTDYNYYYSNYRSSGVPEMMLVGGVWIGILIAVIVPMFFKDKKLFADAEIAPLYALCTEENMKEMEKYLKVLKMYPKKEKLYQWHCYDQEKYAKYVTEEISA